MPDWVSELLRYGPLGAFALAVCWGGWIALRAGGAKAYTLGERYVASTEKLHDTLKESLDVQQTLCTQHGDSVGKISANVSSHDAAMRSAVRSACSMCRSVAQKEFPDSAVKVDEHTREIERIISEV
jgi:hypothetical protein